MIVAVLISGAVFGLMCCLTLLSGIAGVDYIGYRLMLGPPAFIASILVASIIHIGLAGSAINAGSREWLSRLGGLLALAGLAWLVVTGMVFLSALAVNALGLLSIPAIGAWIASTASGAYLGRTSNGAGRVRGWVMAIAPWLFILGLLILVSAGVQGLLHGITASWIDSEVGTAFTTYANALGWRDFDSSAVFQRYGTWLGETERWYVILPLMVAAILLWWLFAKRVDINTFSLHNMYGHRLVRCFLGAANRSLDRSDRGDPFTRLSPDDDLGLAATWTDTDTVMGLCAPGDQVATLPRPIPAYPGPYQIVNTAINLSGSDNLAWQERKAGPFIMTPLYCGFTLAGTIAESDDPDANDAYRPTGQFASSPRGLTLGEAVATSGAAASPNMGYHTTSALAFLLGVFNVRLGRWVANPRQLSRANARRFQDWHHSGPSFALWYLLREVFGTTDKNNEFVYLSDGGHFENLGIYEAVRRRCRYVIACDSGADPDYAFEDLGNAIRKCRIDLNIEIDIDVREIAKIDERRCNGAPCAVGTIRYPEEGNTGTLLYIKSCRRPGAPTDVVQYAGKSAAFPHESTADQFFSESQFESYRKHGYFLATEVLATAMDELRSATRRECEKKGKDSGIAACIDDDNNGNGGDEKGKERKKKDFRNAFRLERLFRRLQQEWHPASPAVSANFTRLAEQVDAAFATLRKSPDLEFLNEQFYPEWRTLLAGKDGEPVRHSPTIWSLPEDPDLLRRGFYFCNSLIQLMENVYLDLGLETEWDHPDNSGWMNVFRHWTWSSMFRVTWAISAATYGRRFRAFCRHRLALQLGEVHARRVHTGKLAADDVDKVLTPKLLNVVERQQIRKLVSGSLAGRKIEVYRLDLEVEQIGEPSRQSQDMSGDLSGDQAGDQADKRPENPPLRCFSVGYGVTTDEIKSCDIDSDEIDSRDDEIDGLLMMFRVQDHLRNMELGRRGLEHLVEAYGPARKLGLPSRREALLHEIDEVVDPQHVAEFRAMFENVLTEKKI